MPTILVENMSMDVYQRLEQVARFHQRSVSSEIVNCLEQFLRQEERNPERTPEDILQRARLIRQKTAHLHLTWYILHVKILGSPG